MPGIEVKSLGFSYGVKRALDGVSFSVSPGRFCALLGPNGAGKSTLFALLTRLFTAAEGEIWIAGHNLARNPRAALANMGVVFQQPTLDLDLSVRRNLTYFAALQGLGGKEARIRIDAALDQLGMKERANEHARDLNGGHRRRAEIARALIHRPSVLLLDEPTVGLDVTSREAIVEHVHELSDTGLSVLWATHLTDEIAPQDQLIVLHQGHIFSDCVAVDFAGSGSVSERYSSLTDTKARA